MPSKNAPRPSPSRTQAEVGKLSDLVALAWMRSWTDRHLLPRNKPSHVQAFLRSDFHPREACGSEATGPTRLTFVKRVDVNASSMSIFSIE